MAKFPSPLLGYNNNVRHKGRVFHIQTEDSGINHPHIITHLFMDGGRILKSVKTSYAEHIGTDAMGDKVRALMKDQHKAMFIALRDGQYDEVVFGKKTASSPENKAVPAPAPSSPESVSSLIADSSPDVAPISQRQLVHSPDSASAIQQSSPKVLAKTELAMPVSKAEPLEPRASAERDQAPPPSLRVPTHHTDPPATETDAAPRVFDSRPEGARDDSSVELVVGVAEVDLLDEGVGIPSIDEELRRPPSPPPPPRIPAAAAAAPAPASARAPVTERRGPSAADLTLDFDALERDTDTSMSPMFHDAELPPPPKNLFSTSRSEPGTGKYRTTEPHHNEPPPPSSTRSPGKAAPAPAPLAPKAAPSDARYAPARPATIFGATAKQAQPASIFGDDLVSDKSLDEVILSYLAEDLDPPRRK